jgi:hypothetical protein
MLELPMAASGGYLDPAIIPDQLDGIAHLHGGLLARRVFPSVF